MKDIDALDQLESELSNRLSFSWISPHCPPFRRVAFVRGRNSMDHTKRIWEAASALGLAVVVIDREGHWLQDPKWSHVRESFIPTNIDPDKGFVQRLIIAIRGYGKPIHGITTVSNRRMVGVARACEELGLPTSPAEAFITAADKFKTYQRELHVGIPAMWVPSIDQLADSLVSAQIQYPAVVSLV
jgi:hypothetical protein